jgi:hypothetical protein
MSLFLFGDRCTQKIEIRCHTYLGDDSDNGLTTGCKAPQSLPVVAQDTCSELLLFNKTLFSLTHFAPGVLAHVAQSAGAGTDKFTGCGSLRFFVDIAKSIRCLCWSWLGKGWKRAQQHKMALNRQLSQQKQLSAEK